MGITLEQYIILVKVERVKELISYNELTLLEIAQQVGYCNTQYLSNLFRDITGYTISTYRDFLKEERKPLTSILV